MARGLIGKKIGMTNIFNQDGLSVACTILQAGPCAVVAKKLPSGKDGYAAIKLAFEPVEPRKLTKPERGVFAKRGLSTYRFLREIRVAPEDLDIYEVGQVLESEVFQPGDYIDVSALTKGRGFAGVIKRHGFHGSSQSAHGTHEAFRHGGSAGASATPAHTWRGHGMPGHLGHTRVTVQNLLIVRAHPAQNLLVVRGAIPGPNGGLVIVRNAVKIKAAA